VCEALLLNGLHRTFATFCSGRSFNEVGHILDGHAPVHSRTGGEPFFTQTRARVPPNHPGTSPATQTGLSVVGREEYGTGIMGGICGDEFFWRPFFAQSGHVTFAYSEAASRLQSGRLYRQLELLKVILLPRRCRHHLKWDKSRPAAVTPNGTKPNSLSYTLFDQSGGGLGDVCAGRNF
jgi:hypothetical protein